MSQAYSAKPGCGCGKKNKQIRFSTQPYNFRENASRQSPYRVASPTRYPRQYGYNAPNRDFAQNTQQGYNPEQNYTNLAYGLNPQQSYSSGYGTNTGFDVDQSFSSNQDYQTQLTNATRAYGNQLGYRPYVGSNVTQRNLGQFGDSPYSPSIISARQKLEDIGANLPNFTEGLRCGLNGFYDGCTHVGNVLPDIFSPTAEGFNRLSPRLSRRQELPQSY